MKKNWFISFCLFPVLVFADASTDLMNALGGLHTMRAHFMQNIHDSRGRVLDQSEGDMALQRPGKFRWEILQPQSQLVIANNNIVWIYDKDLEQATKQKQQNGNGLSPALLLSAPNEKLLQNFVITHPSENQFLLKPKKGADALFSSLTLVFKGQELSSMRMEDKLGQLTQIKFYDIKLNQTLPSPLFVFTPPRGVDVIDQVR